MSTVKLIFMGTPELSKTILAGLLADSRYEVIAVVTQPDRAVGRKKIQQKTPVKQLAETNGLPVYQPEKLSGSPELETLLQLGADGIVTAAFGQFLPKRLLDGVGFAVNVHGSLLPKYRGGAPIQYAIINGEKETGITIMEMVSQMDAGDMIAKKAITITDNDTTGSLFETLAVVGRDLLLETLLPYTTGDIKPQPQEKELVTFAPNIKPEQERIDWNLSNRAVFNLVRGLNPWPIAHTTFQGQRFKIHAVSLVEQTGPAGQVIEKTKKSLIIATGQGAVALETVQPFGKAKMPIAAFLNGLGRDIEVGDQFGN